MYGTIDWVYIYIFFLDKNCRKDLIMDKMLFMYRWKDTPAQISLYWLKICILYYEKV